MNSNIITCQGLTKLFGSKAALEHIDLTVGRGRIVGLLGPNGSGKTTFIKLLCGLLQPTSGSLQVDGQTPGPHTKSVISYLPDRMYFADWMKVNDITDFFADFYGDFDRAKATEMFGALGIAPQDRIKTMSKGTKEKAQLALIMSRQAQLYLLDEPIGGVDPAARDFILNTILTNYSENSTVLLSTHLITDIERVLDEAIFLQNGKVVRHDTVDNIREKEGKSVDQLFREIFAYGSWEKGGNTNVQ
ncbi:MAG: ABC transporter ATP-binding protein [Clostridiales bacterium]